MSETQPENLLENLQIHRWTIHDIHARNPLTDDRVPPEFASEVRRLDGSDPEIKEEHDTLHHRLLAALGATSRRMELDIVESGPTSTFCRSVWLMGADDATFLDLSQDIARSLDDAQATSTTAIKNGVVAVLSGTVGDGIPFTATVKAEADRGFVREEVNGRSRYRHRGRLVFTGAQRLLKAALFVAREKPGPDGMGSADDEFGPPITDYRAFVYDENMQTRGTTNAAKYFYVTFMGCKILDADRHDTLLFLRETQRFIDELEGPAEQKVTLFDALMGYLGSQEATLSVAGFGQSLLTPALADRYAQHMVAKKVPDRAINKDEEVIKKKLQRRRLQFEHGVNVTAPADRFPSLVLVEELPDGTTVVTISGKLKSQRQ